MQTLGERESTILEYIIRDYIRTADPVSSERVRKLAQLELSPATIRNTMAELDEAGYLEQPYTSGGRIPTDQAYRYFVDNLAETDENYLDAERCGLEDFLKIAAKKFGMFTVIAKSPRDLQSTGIDAVFNEPEFHDYEVAQQFAEILEELGDIAETYFEIGTNHPEVHIGRENQFKDSENFSSVFVVSGNPGASTVVFSIGPKRRDYEKAISIIDYISGNFL